MEARQQVALASRILLALVQGVQHVFEAPVRLDRWPDLTTAPGWLIAEAVPPQFRQRPTYEWSGGARLAVVVSNNIEHFAFRAGLGSDSAQLGAAQNRRNYA